MLQSNDAFLYFNDVLNGLALGRDSHDNDDWTRVGAMPESVQRSLREGTGILEARDLAGGRNRSVGLVGEEYWCGVMVILCLSTDLDCEEEGVLADPSFTPSSFSS